jgi:hypothetical protein
MNDEHVRSIAAKFYLTEQLGDPPPEGVYGVWSEPKGHINQPGWIRGEMTYEEAIVVADCMNRANSQWHYTAKPVRLCDCKCS